MQILIDSHFAIAHLRKSLAPESSPLAGLMADRSNKLNFSVASLWEIAIKTRLGKLDPGMPLESIARYFETVGVKVLPVTEIHAVTEAVPVPGTRDPFDRMLLAQCEAEGLRLLTSDRALAGHRLAFKAD